ncbi:uncharacterized protein UMAG_03562 [Mycosarcoma maydis]|uniref:Uncharacterized protein n=1 Tax=Mycosarcoma maydis TaxID=5270 RepID=A0A0D1E1H2_MYCMD|nr:uncharacterized protein UMAG_03562 [Ustilago maydis 521]KIS68475.1 hypothetical protein UMAG_03562 [Ustilago maydis 521]|eukprot:XP_011389998.1 hypothetical protein UMAG_03562 [Ustilago maydis 521]
MFRHASRFRFNVRPMSRSDPLYEQTRAKKTGMKPQGNFDHRPLSSGVEARLASILAVVPEEAGLHGTNRLDTRDQIASYGPRKTAPEIVKVLSVMYLDVASIHTRDPRLSTCISLRKGTHI